MDLVSNQRSQSQWQHGIVVNRGCGDRHCILSSPHPALLLSNLLSQCEPGILVNRGCGDRHCILSILTLHYSLLICFHSVSMAFLSIEVVVTDIAFCPVLTLHHSFLICYHSVSME